MAVMPRPQQIVLPILRKALPGVTVATWVADVDHRKMPLLSIRRIGGVRNERRPLQLSIDVLEMSVYRTDSLAATEAMYYDALEALYKAQRSQTVTPAGYISSIKEAIGAMQLQSPYQDSWWVHGALELGVRPVHSLARSI